MTKRERMKADKVNARIASDAILSEKTWKYIKELNSFSAEQLDKTALIDGDRTYSYRQMFRNWEYYAEVFSALGITGESHRRVGILASFGAEMLTAFFALNMTGASVSFLPGYSALNEDIMRKIIREEGITDLIIPDTPLSMPQLSDYFLDSLHKLLSDDDKAGISHVILLHVPIEGPFATAQMKEESSYLREGLRKIPGILKMEDLLDQYETAPIDYDPSDDRECALILHSSGTTKKIVKPVPFSDRQLNASVNRFLQMDWTRDFRGRAVTVQMFPLNISYVMIDMVLLPLAFGGTVVILPGGVMNPKSYKAMGYYRMNILFTNKIVMNTWRKRKNHKPDLSWLKLIAHGGTYLSADQKKLDEDFIKECGGKVKITNGYGLSELGAACILSTPDRDDDSIGFPMPGVDVRIYDEEEDKYYSIEDGPRIGGLFISSASMSSGRLDDQVYFEMEEIDGRPYYCTQDLVQVNEDGSLSARGRMNRFFVNEAGSRFESGIVENAVSARPGIRECVVVPEYSKNLHDTVPSLYIITEGSRSDALQIVKKALCHVFITEDYASSMRLPESTVITDQLPRNAAGKVDVHAIKPGRVKGEKYKIKPVYNKDKLNDLTLVPSKAEDDDFNIAAMIRSVLSNRG